jgi:hypothetical protein
MGGPMTSQVCEARADDRRVAAPGSGCLRQTASNPVRPGTVLTFDPNPDPNLKSQSCTTGYGARCA